jgi:Cysteine rich repeat
MTVTTPTFWTTARDFAAVVLVCVIGAIALFALVERAHAGGSLPPYPPAADYGGVYERGPEPAWIACRPDVQRYCPNVVPGGGRLLSCLAGNKDRLSYGCHESLLRAWTYLGR